MFDAFGTPKITDFGISRAVQNVGLGFTFARAGSQPWTPAEPDDGNLSERRDLYSWAAICVACITGRLDYRTTGELRTALGKLGEVVPREVLRACFADTPEERPLSATAMLWELDEFHSERFDTPGGTRWIAVEVSAEANAQLAELGPDQPDSGVHAFLADFADRGEVRKDARGALEFLGNYYVARGVRESENAPWLTITDIRPASGLQRFGFDAPVTFVLRTAPGLDASECRWALTALEGYIESYLAREADEQRRQDEERYLVMLQDVVASRMRALRELQALPYSEGEWAAGEFTAVIESEMTLAIGEQRVVRTEGVILVFQVVRAVAGRIFLAPVNARGAHKPPARGVLEVETVAQRKALERQEEAVKAVRADLAVSAAHKRLLHKPQTAASPELSGRPGSDDLSPDKLKILDAALGLREIVVVRGPPGTGKTRLITEIVKRTLRERPSARVLVAAQTHTAIDHVIEKLLDFDELRDRIVRIARTDDDKVSAKVRDALLPRKLEAWCSRTREAARNFMRCRGEALALDATDVEISIRLEALLALYQRAVALRHDVVQGQADLEVAEGAIREPATTVGAEILERKETATTAALTVAELERENRLVTDNIRRLREELRASGPQGASLADVSEMELLDWHAAYHRDDPKWLEFRRELDLQVGWLDVLGGLKQFEEIVLRSSSVVAGTCVGLASSEGFKRTEFDLCIIDEASKATATEALVPMVRGHTWLVVGDPEQLPPFEQEDVDVEGYSASELRETLLDYLLPKLPPECVHELRYQHRMCYSIGELISHVFYRRRLVNQRPDSERAGWMLRRYPKAVTWIDTLSGRESAFGHSFINRVEVEQVIKVLSDLQYGAGRARTVCTVGVIAGYAAQARLLDSKIQTGSFSSLSIEVNTVDAFQGREADVCIFSVTRSNSRDFLGFLRSMKRLNVALSRARDLLVIVGDQSFCYRAAGDNPFPGVIDHIEAHPDTCETRHAG
jgi:hypothetical protein